MTTNREGWLTSPQAIEETKRILLTALSALQDETWMLGDEEARLDALCRMALAALQLTAPPDGVREALEEISHGLCPDWCFDMKAHQCPACIAKQALAAPAPAKVCRHGCVDGWIWKGEWDTDGHGNIQPINHPCPNCSKEGKK